MPPAAPDAQRKEFGAARRQTDRPASPLPVVPPPTPPPCRRCGAVMSDWQVDLVEDNISEFHVAFKGPPDSARRCSCRCRPIAAELDASILFQRLHTRLCLTCVWWQC